MAKPSSDPPVEASEWWKHLRPFGKRNFHKKVRVKVRAKMKQLAGGHVLALLD